MYNPFLFWFGTLLRLFRSRRDLALENRALRQQLAALKRRHPRPRLDLFDKLFWIIAHRFWSGWKEALIVVTPETVVRWHRRSAVPETDFESEEAERKKADAEGSSGVDLPHGS